MQAEVIMVHINLQHQHGQPRGRTACTGSSFVCVFFVYGLVRLTRTRNASADRWPATVRALRLLGTVGGKVLDEPRLVRREGEGWVSTVRLTRLQPGASSHEGVEAAGCVRALASCSAALSLHVV